MNPAATLKSPKSRTNFDLPTAQARDVIVQLKAQGIFHTVASLKGGKERVQLWSEMLGFGNHGRV